MKVGSVLQRCGSVKTCTAKIFTFELLVDLSTLLCNEKLMMDHFLHFLLSNTTWYLIVKDIAGSTYRNQRPVLLFILNTPSSEITMWRMASFMGCLALLLPMNSHILPSHEPQTHSTLSKDQLSALLIWRILLMLSMDLSKRRISWRVVIDLLAMRLSRVFHLAPTPVIMMSKHN